MCKTATQPSTLERRHEAPINAAQRARRLVLEFGWNSTAYQILNPGIQHWFSSAVPAVAGFVRRGRTWVVAGAPVCALENLDRVTADLECCAARQGCRVCYMAAAARLEGHLRASTGHARIAIGAQPVWNPQSWKSIVASRSSLRAQLSRARNKGVKVVSQVPPAANHDSRLNHCLNAWLQARPMPPMHFLVEPHTWGGESADRLLLVAEQQGLPMAFLLASPVPQRRGFLVEQIIRAPEAPNGTAELLIDALMTLLASSGHTFLTMGLVPLATHADQYLQQNPMWIRALMAWARAHGRRFYHFDGLEHFRAKLAPDHWEPIYAICNQRRFSMAALYAMLAAFSDGPLCFMVAHALARALAAEVRHLARPEPRP